MVRGKAIRRWAVKMKFYIDLTREEETLYRSLSADKQDDYFMTRILENGDGVLESQHAYRRSTPSCHGAGPGCHATGEEDKDD